MCSLFYLNYVFSFQRLLIIKKYANSATENYFKTREVHMLCLINKENQRALGSLVTLAKQSNLRWGGVTTTSASIDECGINASAGDIIMELVSCVGSDPDKFMSDVCSLTGAGDINLLKMDASVIAVSNNIL